MGGGEWEVSCFSFLLRSFSLSPHTHPHSSTLILTLSFTSFSSFLLSSLASIALSTLSTLSTLPLPHFHIHTFALSHFLNPKNHLFFSFSFFLFFFLSFFDRMDWMNFCEFLNWRFLVRGLGRDLVRDLVRFLGRFLGKGF